MLGVFDECGCDVDKAGANGVGVEDTAEGFGTAGVVVFDTGALIAFCCHVDFPVIPGSSDTRGTGLFSPCNHCAVSNPGVEDFVSG